MPPYVRSYTAWQDYPDTSTPITAAKLQNMDDGSAAAAATFNVKEAYGAVGDGVTDDTAAIQAAMRGEFERVGVWDLLRKQIPASDYTRPGDPLRLDVAYRPNWRGHPTDGDLSRTPTSKDPLPGIPLIRMFHAVSLEPGVEMTKVLAFSAAGLRAGVERVEKAALELTAVIEPAARIGATDEEPDRLEMYRFGVETMEEHQIRVLTTSDMGRVAETARRELSI